MPARTGAEFAEGFAATESGGPARTAAGFCAWREHEDGEAGWRAGGAKKIG